MKLAGSILLLLAAACGNPSRPSPVGPVAHDHDIQAISRVRDAIGNLDCVSLEVEDRSPSFIDVAEREIHDQRCGGDPQFAHVRNRFRVSPAGGVQIYDVLTDSYVPVPTSGSRVFFFGSVEFMHVTAVDQATAEAKFGRALVLEKRQLTYGGELCTIRERETVSSATLFDDMELAVDKRDQREPTATHYKTDCQDEAGDVYVSGRTAYAWLDGAVYVFTEWL